VLYRVYTQEPEGQLVFKKFAIHATPTILLLDGDGAEVDWTVGYDPPAEKFQELLEKMKAGGPETYKGLAAAYAKNPKDVPTLFKFAQKWADRYDDVKSAEKYKAIVALDPDGKMGLTDYQKDKVSYTELAEFSLGSNAIRTRPPDPAPLQAFLKKYKDGQIVKDAYSRLAQGFYGRTAPKDEAAKFFEDYAARYPEDPLVLSAYVRRILQDKDNLDKGLQLARKAVDLATGGAKGNMLQLLAQVYLQKGDKAEAADTAEEILKVAGAGVPSMAAIPAGEAAPAPPPARADMSAMNAARIFIEADKPDRALAVFGPEYLKKNLDKAPALASYVTFWLGQGKNLESALEAAQKGVALTPDAYTGWNNLSQVNLKLKKYDDALKAAERALELAPAQPPQIKDNIRKSIDQIKAAALEKK
jgi:tetratricopeptide (TPR) repeat protein